MKKILSLGMLISFLFFSCQKEDDETFNLEHKENTTEVVDNTLAKSLPIDQSSGYDDGFFWNVWRANDSNGQLDINFPSSPYPGNFELSYSNIKNVVGGKGWKGGALRKISYNIGYLSGSYEFVGVYGWTKDPDVEYYVAEKGDGGIPGNGYTFKKKYKSLGSWYKFYEKKITGLPCALNDSGNCTFWRYKSVRQNNPQNGNNHAVNIGDHAHIWRLYGTAGGSQNKWGKFTAYQVFGMETYGDNETGAAKINATIW